MSEAPYRTCLAAFTGTNSGIVPAGGAGARRGRAGPAAAAAAQLEPCDLGPLGRTRTLGPEAEKRGSQRTTALTAHTTAGRPISSLSSQSLSKQGRNTGGAPGAHSAALRAAGPCFSTDRLVYTAELPEGTARGVPYPYVEPIENGQSLSGHHGDVTAEWPTEIEPPWVPFNVTYPPARNGEQLGGIAVFVNGEPYKAPGSIPACNDETETSSLVTKWT